VREFARFSAPSLSNAPGQVQGENSAKTGPFGSTLRNVGNVHGEGPSVLELVGEGHQGLVSLLLDRVDQVASGDLQIPRMVILEGASGVGKTRVVREFYRRLRDNMDRDGGYWPDLAEAGIGDPYSRDPLPARKSTGPDARSFHWPAEALPGFGWWQLHCERMQAGGEMDVIAQALPEIAAHLVPMTLAWRQAASSKDKLAAHRDEVIAKAREALRDRTLEGAAEVLREFDIIIPCFYTAVSWISKAVGSAKEYRKQRRDYAQDVELGDRVADERRSAAAELANLILATTHPKLPGIVVIEDIHLMDEALGQLLDHLLAPRSGRAVTVVAMAWPENRNLGAYADWVSAAVDRGWAQIVPMPALSTEDLRQIVLSYAPNTPQSVADEVAQRYSNPLLIEATLSSRLMERAIRDNGASLPIKELPNYPPSLREIYRERFRQLPVGVQEALAIAAGCLPEPNSMQLHPFLRDRVVEAVRAHPGRIPEADSVLAGIESAVEDQIWLLPEEVADRFKEPPQVHAAYEHLGEHVLLEEEKRALLDSMQQALSDWIESTRDGFLLDNNEESALVSRWLLALSRSANRSQAMLVAAYRVACDLAATYQYAEAIDCVHPYLDPHREDDPQLLGLRASLAHWRGESGRVDQAVDDLTKLAAEAEHLLGIDDPLAIDVRHELAYWLAEEGRIGEAVAQHEKVLAARKRILGKDHPDTLKTRYYLARLQGSAGRPKDALDQLTEVLADTERVLGPRHTDTLAVRGKIARWKAEIGDINEAIKDFEELLVDTAEVLGDDHPHTLTTRYNLAGHQGDAGQVNQAIAALTQVLSERERILGPDNPHTLSTRERLAVVIGNSGNTGQAITDLRHVLEDRERILGSQHRHTLKTRHNLAVMVAREEGAST